MGQPIQKSDIYALITNQVIQHLKKVSFSLETAIDEC